jgi:hypothetical protein
VLEFNAAHLDLYTNILHCYGGAVKPSAVDFNFVSMQAAELASSKTNLCLAQYDK